jgi:nitrogen fixation-related uncharacterized protein
VTEPEPLPRARPDAAREVDNLIAANAASNATLTRLVDKVREDAANRERKIELLEAESKQMRRILIGVSITAAALVVLALFNAITISQARHNAQQTANAARDAASTNKLLLGCFTPESECSRLNAEQQKAFLNEIKKYELVGFYCLRTNTVTEDPNGTKLTACINRLYPGGPQLPNR